MSELDGLRSSIDNVYWNFNDSVTSLKHNVSKRSESLSGGVIDDRRRTSA